MFPIISYLAFKKTIRGIRNGEIFENPQDESPVNGKKLPQN
jgi:hypothetical protein